MSKGEKKKDSTLSVISCILAGVAFILPLPIILSFPLALAGAIVGLVDIGTKRNIDILAHGSELLSESLK